MKQYIWIFTLTLFAASCGGGGEIDPAAELASLKAQKLEIEAKIADLQKSQGGTTAGRKTRVVSLKEIETTTFKHFIDVQGRVEAENNVSVTSKMPGTLTRINVKNGQYVKKGQLLAALDDEVMQRGLAELETQLATAKDLFERQKGLWDQKIGTEVQYIQAKSQVEALERRMETTREQMGQSSIYAPISGTVDMVMLKVGQAIAPGAPLCQIVNTGDMNIKANVPESYIALVKKGASVMLYFPDLDKEISSRVTYVSKSISPMSRTFEVECSLPNRSEFRPNMVAVLRITDYAKKNAVVVPVNIIQRDERGQFILTAEKKGEGEAVVKKVAVESGKSYNGKVEIKKGLQSGDYVITTGWQNVNANEAVTF